MIDRPIFILGVHKSGTSLLRSLLSGHPSVFVVPFESHFFPLLGRWVEYPFQRTVPQPEGGEREFLDRAVAWVRKSNSSSFRFADNAARDIADVEEFSWRLRRLMEPGAGARDDVRFLFCAYVRAIHFALRGRDLEDGRRIVEKSVENAEFACELQRAFPDASFLHIVRNPYAVLTSFRRSRSRDGYPWLGKIYSALWSGHYHLQRNRRLLERYHVLLYEDLVNAPRETMERAAGALELPFRQELLSPTYLGRPWTGNSSTGEELSGIDRSPLEAWKDEISSLEVELVNRHLSHLLTEFEYAAREAEGNPYFRNEGEGLKEYVANRLLLARAWRV